MNDEVKPVWTFSLSNDEDYPETNSHRIVRYSIWPPGRNDAMLASETCRQLLEGCPEWMIKVARRVQQQRQQQQRRQQQEALQHDADMEARHHTNRTFAVRFMYDSTMETILLIDGAELPTNRQQVDRMPTVHIGLSMATAINSEQTCNSNMDMVEIDDVLVSMNSPLDFICMAFGNDPQSMRFSIRVLHQTASSTGRNRNESLDLNHAIRMETSKDNLYVVIWCERLSSMRDVEDDDDGELKQTKGQNTRKPNARNQRRSKRVQGVADHKKANH